MRDAADADFVHAIVGTYDQRPAHTQPVQYLGSTRHPTAFEHPHELDVGVGRVGQRAEDVEQRSRAEFPSWHNRMPRGAMMGRREHETHAAVTNAGGDLGGREVDTCTGSFQDIGTAAGAAGGAVAVFGDMYAGSGRDEGRCGRDVEGSDTITAGTAGIDQRPDVDIDMRSEFAHDRRRGGYLVYGLPFHAQTDEETGDLGRTRLARHDRHHDIMHVGEWE